MTPLAEIAPAFIDIAHRVVWATVATVDASNRPRSRVLHPIWEMDGDRLVGWIATVPTSAKASHLEHSAFVSVNYWDARHDVATAECEATWFHDDETCERVWTLFATGPAPVGYDPSTIPPWADGPMSPTFSVLRLDPWRLRVFPGSVLFRGNGEVLTWSA